MGFGVVVLGVMLAVSGKAAITPLTCDSTADPLLIRSEGLSERTGAIVLTCTGSAGGFVGASMTLFVSGSVTNRLTGETIDAVMTAETDTGVRMVGGSPILVGRNTIIFDFVSFMLPATGRTSIVISNIRVAADPNSERPVTVLISTGGLSNIGLRTNPVTVGVMRRGLLANASTARIVCTGSPLPENLNFGSLVIAGTRSATVRVTEGAPTSFERRGAGASNGVRILIRYRGFPGAARLFVPDIIAGSTALEPTSAGDLGLTISGGKHAPSSGGTLLLARVKFADGSGAGDTPVFGPGVPGTGALLFNEVSEVALREGNGYAVYEVVDANGTAIESAQIPTFVAMPPLTGQDGTLAFAQVSFGPISTVTAASANAPVPRFSDVMPGLDCQVLRDCNAGYFPKLFVDAPVLAFRAPAGTPGFYSHYIRVLNDSGGVLNWSTTIAYKNGSGWLRAAPAAGVNNASINLHALPERLAVGTYEATFTVDAGPLAGSRSYNVTLEVTAAPQQPAPQPPAAADRPRYWSAGNAANLPVTTVVPGSQASIEGAGLRGRTVAVTFDGLAAQVVSASDALLTVVVPVELGSRPSAQLQVVVDGVPGVPLNVALGAAAPAIFAGGVYNQDGFRNEPGNPELAGNILQVFATGLPLASLGTITARIHDREIVAPLYAGPAPGTAGVQQVNMAIPVDLETQTTEVQVCGTPLNNPAGRVCSLGVRVGVR